MLEYDNVHAPINEFGKVTEDFTDEDRATLKEAQIALRRLGTQMLSFAVTQSVAMGLIEARYDVVKAGRALIGYSNQIGTYGGERNNQRNSVLAALRIKNV